jgi:hypothetical protein
VTVGGVASNTLTYTVTVPPTLTSLSPPSGPVATAVTISGSNFGASQGTSTVTFNGTAATPTSWSATSIVVPVPTGASSGNVVVTVGSVSSNALTYTVTVPPRLTSLSPSSGAVASAVTINGTGFGASKGTSTVTFNGTPATPTTWSATSIVVPVPAGATTGNVVVTVAGLAGNALTFTVVPTPTLTSLSPSSGAIATAVTIGGNNFGATQGTSTVTFNGAAAAPAAWSATSITVPVPVGATTGNVVVTVGGFASNALTFTVTAAPTITSLSPSSGPLGTVVTISGSGFGAGKGNSTVTFNSTAATPTSWSASSIVVPVPTGASTGNVVVKAGGQASNAMTYTVTVGPVMTNLSPAHGPVSTVVTITGSNFGSTMGSSTITFNGVAATPTSWSGTTIVVPVPAGALSGNVVVTVGGVASPAVAFNVNPSNPTGIKLKG